MTVETAEPPIPEAPSAPETTKPGEPQATRHARVRSRRPSSRRLLTVLILLSLATATITAALQWHEADDLTHQQETRKQISTKAGEFGQALLSYDHKNLKNARARVLSLAADDFAKTYDVAFTGSLEGVITKLQATATATVRSVYLENTDDNRAKAIVVMDSEVNSTAGNRRVIGSYLEMELIRQKGQWRINTVASIGAINESMTKPDGKQQDTGGLNNPAPDPTPSSRP